MGPLGTNGFIEILCNSPSPQKLQYGPDDHQFRDEQRRNHKK
jgi:hypothetical protein